MISPALHSVAPDRALLAVLLAAGCAADEPTQPLPPVDSPGDLVAEVVSSSEDIAVDLTTDERHVYWLSATLVPDPHGPPRRRGSVVRWDTSSAERVVLAAIGDAKPVEVDVSSAYVYWIELRGYHSDGYRELGHDRLLRVSKMGGLPEVVAAEQRFDEQYGQVAAANGYVYWLSEGALRRSAEDGVLAAIETLADNLDRPSMLAVGTTKACFHTGDASGIASSIWCMPANGGAIEPIGHSKAPYDMLFFDERLYWSNAGGVVEHALPYQGAAIGTVPYSSSARELAADATALFWTVAGTPSGYEAVKGFIGDTYTVIRETQSSGLRAPASDGVHVYFSESGRVVRTPKGP